MTYYDDQARAGERILALEGEALVQVSLGRPIQARDCRVSAMVLRTLWEVPA
jgi:hypothetical protein